MGLSMVSMGIEWGLISMVLTINMVGRRLCAARRLGGKGRLYYTPRDF